MAAVDATGFDAAAALLAGPEAGAAVGGDEPQLTRNTLSVITRLVPAKDFIAF
ncbi:MAG TPA: hypothetical protein VK457_16870 [Chloroflexota bacterium]|nr:hypothetical protein [Chloroflexota bacterium]